jgi:hypothetical protein
MWPTASKAIPSRIPQARRGNQENMQARRVFEYQCSPTVYTWPFVPTSVAHPSFISWWQELHDHIFNEPVHSFCLELMPDFQPTSEVMHLFFLLFSSMSFLTDHDFFS